MEAAEPTLYERVGGMAFFDALVGAFYDGVRGDELLAPLYPEFPDLAPAARRLGLFLAQYWGGPRTYLDERGHPRLRMRHFAFHIGPLERDRWLLHMTAAVESVCADLALPASECDEIAAELTAYFVPAAEHLRNDTGLPITPAGYPRA